MEKHSSFRREAVDAYAAKYWTDYFADSGYGALWVRKMPMRLKAALRRQAKKAQDLEVTVLGHAIDRDRLTVEGVARAYQPGRDGRSVRAAWAYQADFDHQGRLLRFFSMPSP